VRVCGTKHSREVRRAVKITVAICTWNRAELLDLTLSKMTELSVPPGADWEIVIVDNNSFDGTPEIVAKYLTVLPIRSFLEKKQGHTWARNRAVSAATGELIIWTDDDVLVDKDWLKAYYEAAQAWPEAAFFGGRIDPLFEVDPPRWINDNLSLVTGPFALCFVEGPMRKIGEKEYLIGANMAFRRKVFEGMAFNVELGRIGEYLISGDETELVSRLQSRGQFGVWVPLARVRHQVSQKRMTKRYIWDWSLGLGLTEVRRDGGVVGKTCLSLPRWVIRSYLESRIKAWMFAPWNAEKWLKEYKRTAYNLGLLKGVRERNIASHAAR
jgi:glycosyltransferase involved in cell wall biosynthesis